MVKCSYKNRSGNLYKLLSATAVKSDAQLFAHRPDKMKSLVLVLFLVAACNCAENPEEIFAWKQMEFNWPNAGAMEEAVKSGAYIPENNLPLGIEVWKDKMFVTVPRWKAGVAASLNWLPLNSSNKSAALTPYPDWKANTIPPQNESIEQNGIVSVFRVSADACDRLWVMDTGLAGILGEGRQVSKPALVIFDLKTDTLIRRYEFKPSDLKDDSFFANVVVDVTPDKCDEAFAYIPDLGGYTVVVYSFQENDSWKVTHNFFHFDPLSGDLTVGGLNFQWTDGVFGLALSNIRDDGFRTMYFHALASTKEFSVSTHVLKNRTLATSMDSYHQFKLEGEKGPNTQTSASDFDEKTGVLFLSQLTRDAIACWNTAKPLNPQNLGLIAQDKERLEFTNDLKINGDYIYFLSDKMPKFLYTRLNPQDVNYRIFRTKIADAVKGTPCE